MATLSAQAVRELDQYAFLAVLGKRVIHPGGRTSTGRLLAWADVQPDERVLDMRKMAWLMPRMARAVPFLGYVFVMGVQPDPATDTTREVS